MKSYDLTLFIFRRDLRLHDNTALLAALQQSTQVLPCFILDPIQVEENSYKSVAGLQFMLESLEDLQQQLANKNAKLYLFYGTTLEVIEQIITSVGIQAIYFNHDYTPYSRKRDQAITELCQAFKINVCPYHDALLNPPHCVSKPDGSPYRVFTPYYQHAKKFPVSQPKKNSYQNYYTEKLPFAMENKIFNKILPERNAKLAAMGGRRACIEKLVELKHIKNYDTERDFLFKSATSGLSPYLKFTNCSVREIYYAVKKNMPSPDGLLRELYWRDFFSMIAFHFPRVFGHAFQEKYNRRSLWINDKTAFNAWCRGQTGFPIVDAGMRELNQTGYMHNRARLITASFLVKDLHIDWRWGEKYFAKKLIDYDPAVNNGNWQWVASTGTDAQPYFRIFNPWLQQRKFDPNADYIKQWVPEISHLDAKIIHQWQKEKYHSLAPDYLAPMLDHAKESAKAKTLYKN